MTCVRAGVGAFLVAVLAACAGVGPVSVGVVDREALLADLRVLSADDMEGRLVGSPGGERARAYVLERFAASGIRPIGDSFEQPFTFATRREGAEREMTGVNVIGLVPGTVAPDRYIVVTAHYDHVGVRNGDVYNGANDNASGTAALFALGRHFSAHPPASSIVLAALDGEEGGLRGARRFVAGPPVPLEAIPLNVNLDMIAREPDNLMYAAGTHHYPFLRPYLEEVAAGAPIRLVLGHDEPGRPGMDDWTRDSDHFAFHEAGIPFVYFGVEDFENHHKATDVYETITHDFYVRAVETIIAAIRVFDANLDAIVQARTGR